MNGLAAPVLVPDGPMAMERRFSELMGELRARGATEQHLDVLNRAFMRCIEDAGTGNLEMLLSGSTQSAPVPDQPAPAAVVGHPPSSSIMMHNVPTAIMIIEYPNRSNNFCIISCPECGRDTFDSSLSIYAHVNQAGGKHRLLVENAGGAKPVAATMQRCGIPVYGATQELVAAHNIIVQQLRKAQFPNKRKAEKE